MEAPLPRIRGRAGVLGRATGLVTYLDDLPGDGDAGTADPIIVVTRFSRPEIYAWAPHLAGVAAVNGSRLCHLASLLRTHRPHPVPYLYGLPDIGEVPLSSWAEIVVDAESAYLQPLPDGRAR